MECARSVAGGQVSWRRHGRKKTWPTRGRIRTGRGRGGKEPSRKIRKRCKNPVVKYAVGYISRDAVWWGVVSNRNRVWRAEKKTLQITHVASATTRQPTFLRGKIAGEFHRADAFPGGMRLGDRARRYKRTGGLNNTFLTVRHVLKVDIGVAERPSGDHVAAHPDGQHCADRAEFLEQHCLGNVRMQVSNVQRSHLSAVWTLASRRKTI